MSVKQKQKTQTEIAARKLRQMIFDGKLVAGSDHLESELAEQLAMSRTPVREATLVLESQGLLVVRPRKGVRIASLSASDMDEIYAILTELEGLAAYIVTEKGYSVSELARLSGYLTKMEAAVRAGHRANWAKADEGFHTELVRLTNNKRLIGLVANFNDRVRCARTMTLHLRELLEKSNTDHRALFEAIKEGNAEKAKQLHRWHRIEARKIMVGLIEQLDGH